jgi:hypothetical protein
MSIDVGQFRDLTQRVLKGINLFSHEAEELLVFTVAAESLGGMFLRQKGGGPALGVMQMEPATHDDIWVNYLAYREELGEKVLAVSGMGNGPDVNCLEYNLAYSIAMARIHYRRVPAPLPGVLECKKIAAYWKRYYNTYEGAGDEKHALELYRDYYYSVWQPKRDI